jgi:hypothetical protein
MSATAAPEGCESHETVWPTLWNVQVTVPVPLALPIVTECGSNDRELVAVTKLDADRVTTEICCEPVCVTLPDVIDAVIVALPFATPVTTPETGSTVALLTSLELQVAADAPGKVAPF